MYARICKRRKVMGNIILNETKPRTNAAKIKYAIGSAVLLVLLVVLITMTWKTTAAPSDKESEEASARPMWDTVIRINEVMTDNTIYVPGSNGRCYDWIELYNSGYAAVDLSGYYLSDNEDKLDKYKIEELLIKPGEYVLVYMSRLSGVDENGIIHTNFALSSLGETVYLSDSAGNIVSAMTVPGGGANVSYGILGSELVWMSTPTPGSGNTGAGSDDLATLEYELISIRINEFMTRNKAIIYDCEGDYSDWVEIYNYSDETVDLSGYTMTDNRENTDKWEFPEGTVLKPRECMTVFCSGKDKVDSAGYIHTSFRLGKDEAEIVIYSPQGKICAAQELVFIPENSSYGFVSDSDAKAFFSMPTPGEPNTTPAVEYTEDQLKKMQGIYE